MARKIVGIGLVCILILPLGTNIASAQSLSLSIFPEQIRQGDPFLVEIDGGIKTSSIKKITFDGKKAGVFMHQGNPAALVGIDLNKKSGTYELRAQLKNGEIIKRSVTVEKRDKKETPLGIPEKLGGNTKKSQDKLVATLQEDNKSLTSLRTENKALWKNPFIQPLKQIFVTSPYGNSRITGAYSIPHKGADYRAQEGMEVLAVNRGVVRVAKTFRNHGKTVVLDHGLGLMTFYLHLSKIKVKVGETVEQGQIIGLSGQSGYAEGAHLHFSVRISDIAIDPEKFFELFQQEKETKKKSEGY